MEGSLEEALRKVESLLKDRCAHYLVVVTDGEHVSKLTDSRLVAHGMCCQLIEENKENWREREWE